ncbi:hypothetical protein S245_067809, partial [Arachis hypogaea]
ASNKQQNNKVAVEVWFLRTAGQCPSLVADAVRIDAFVCQASNPSPFKQCDRKNGVRCPCWNGIPSKRRLRPEDFQQDDLISQETDPSQHHDPTYAPTLDANFSMDHMPFRSKRSKRAPRNRRSARDKTQPKIPHNLCSSDSCQVDLTGEREWQSRRPHHPRSKLPRRSNCLQKHYNYLTLVCSDGVVHESALLCMNADKIPKAFNLAFVPTRSMDLTGVELAVNSKDHPKRFGDSNVIRQQLAPPCFCFVTHLSSDYAKSDQRVITIVATMLSKTSSQHQWFMPTMIRVSHDTCSSEH